MAHKWQLGVEWYRKELRTKNTDNKKLVGEKTPELIYVEDSLPRIKDVCPGAKFLLFLRCPIRRAYSNWSMMVDKVARVIATDHNLSSYNPNPSS